MDNIIKYQFFNNIINNLTRSINLIDVCTEKEIQLNLLRNKVPTKKNMNISTKKNKEKKILSYNDFPLQTKDNKIKKGSSEANRRYIKFKIL